MESGDLAQQISRLDGVRPFALEDSDREGAYPLMHRGKLGGKDSMKIRGKEHVVD